MPWISLASFRSRIARNSDHLAGLWAASCSIAHRSAESSIRPPAAQDEPPHFFRLARSEDQLLDEKREHKAQGSKSQTLQLRQHARHQHDLPGGEEKTNITNINLPMRYHYQSPDGQQLNLPGGKWEDSSAGAQAGEDHPH